MQKFGDSLCRYNAIFATTTAAAAVKVRLAEANEKIYGHLPIARALLNCKTTSDLIQYARNAGADIVKNGGSHMKIKKNGVTVIQDCGGKKKSLCNSSRKRAIEDFKAMGIAWEKDGKRGGCIAAAGAPAL